MPLPSPRKGEEQGKFVNRCMSNEQAKKDFPDQKQRSAVCFSRFRKGKANELTEDEAKAIEAFLPTHGVEGKKKKKKKKKRRKLRPSY